ncbi:MAG: hypothetical protein WBE63_13495, partial [Acidobacteriaceae bacterium]
LGAPEKCRAWLGWHLSELLSIYLMLEAAVAMQKGKRLKMGNLGRGLARKSGISTSGLHPAWQLPYPTRRLGVPGEFA